MANPKSHQLLMCSVDEFQEWIRNGIRRVEKSEFVRTPLGSRNHSQGSVLAIKLSRHYARQLRRWSHAIIPCDGIERVSLETSPVTIEWKIRMSNLGETWIPFKFCRQWFVTVGTGLPASTHSIATSHYVGEQVERRVRPATLARFNRHAGALFGCWWTASMVPSALGSLDRHEPVQHKKSRRFQRSRNATSPFVSYPSLSPTLGLLGLCDVIGGRKPWLFGNKKNDLSLKRQMSDTGQILSMLSMRHPNEWFDSSKLEVTNKELFQTPRACVLVSLGLALRSPDAAFRFPTEKIARWTEYLRTVLRSELANHRTTRNPQNDDQEFENLVVTLLAVADWVNQPDVWRVPQFVSEYDDYDGERLTHELACIAGAIYGAVVGYSRIGGVIPSLEIRNRISSYVLETTLAEHGF